MLQNAYADQGGMHGSGFNSPGDMVDNIPMWKLSMKDGKVTSAAMYKDREGRKRVAIATDGSDHGKKAITDVVKSDLRMTRAHMEVSGKSLSFLKKHTNLHDYAHRYDAAKQYHEKNGDSITAPPEHDEELTRHPDLKNYLYSRKIGNQVHTKVLLGTIGKKIV